MADLGLNPAISKMKAAKTAGEWYDAFNEFADLAYHSATNVWGPAARQEASGVAPTGLITAWAGPADANNNLQSPSTEWLICNGASVARSAQPDLFRVIGTAFGSASATTFNLPDLGRRVIIGKGGTKAEGSNGPDATLGATGGNESHVITEAELAEHHHDAGTGLTVTTDGAHSHTIRSWRNETGASGLTGPTANATGTTSSAGAHRHDITGNTNFTGAASPEAIPLYSKALVLTYIIKT